jgi:predicted HAD superfamily Cof-like phosphohydrolase
LALETRTTTFNTTPTISENKMTIEIIKDQETFMLACDQTVDSYNEDQYNMYLTLIREEFDELQEALIVDDRAEQLDALIDILVVTIGAIHSAGFDAQGAWDEVMGTNFAKIDSSTGKVNKRADGKVLKPADWKAPELNPYLVRSN